MNGHRTQPLCNRVGPFCMATDTPVLNFWWCLFWVLRPAWISCVLSCLCDPPIHILCNCIEVSMAAVPFLIHIDSNCRSIVHKNWWRIRVWTHDRPCCEHRVVNYSATQVQRMSLIINEMESTSIFECTNCCTVFCSDIFTYGSNSKSGRSMAMAVKTFGRPWFGVYPISNVCSQRTSGYP